MLLKARLRARAHDRVLRDDRAAAGAGGRGDGECRGQGRSRRARRIVARFRPAHRRDRAVDLARCRATNSTSARPSNWATCCSRSCSLPGGKKGKTGAYGTDASILESLAPLHPVPAQVLEWRQLTKLKSTYADALGEEDRRRDRPGAHLLRAGRDGDRAAVLVRAQHPEHPDPHRGGAKNPPRLCRRAGTSAAVGRLQPDRTASRRACRRRPRAEARLPRGHRHSRADRERGVRRAARPAWTR